MDTVDAYRAIIKVMVDELVDVPFTTGEMAEHLKDSGVLDGKTTSEASKTVADRLYMLGDLAMPPRYRNTRLRLELKKELGAMKRAGGFYRVDHNQWILDSEAHWEMDRNGHILLEDNVLKHRPAANVRDALATRGTAKKKEDNEVPDEPTAKDTPSANGQRWTVTVKDDVIVLTSDNEVVVTKVLSRTSF